MNKLLILQKGVLEFFTSTTISLYKLLLQHVLSTYARQEPLHSLQDLKVSFNVPHTSNFGTLNIYKVMCDAAYCHVAHSE